MLQSVVLFVFSKNLCLNFMGFWGFGSKTQVHWHNKSLKSRCASELSSSHQIVDLISSFIGMDGFHVGHGFHDAIIQENSIASASFSAKRNNFSSFLGCKRLSKTNLPDSSLSLLIELRYSDKVRNDCLRLSKSLHEHLLNQLKLNELLAKLSPVLAVIESSFVGSRSHSSSNPSYCKSRSLQDLVNSSLEILCLLKSHVFRHKDVFKKDILILHHHQSHLVFDFSRGIAFRSVCDDKTLDFSSFSFILRPDDTVRADISVTYPSFVAVDDVTAFNFLCSGLKVGCI